MHLINICNYKSRKQTTGIKGVYVTFVHPFCKTEYIYRSMRYREMLLKIVLTDPYIVTIGCLIIGDHIRLISIVFLFVVIYRTLVSHEWG